MTPIMEVRICCKRNSLRR